jgi:transposase
MLMLPPSVRIFISTEPTDMRKSFDTLAALVRDFMRRNPMNGHFFVFRNKKGDKAKILFWDRTGFCLWYKRLEKGTFRFPQSDARSVEVEASELALLLEGIELQGAKRRKRYVHRPTVAQV